MTSRRIRTYQIEAVALYVLAGLIGAVVWGCLFIALFEVTENGEGKEIIDSVAASCK